MKRHLQQTQWLFFIFIKPGENPPLSGSCREHNTCFLPASPFLLLFGIIFFKRAKQSSLLCVCVCVWIYILHIFSPSFRGLLLLFCQVHCTTGAPVLGVGCHISVSGARTHTHMHTTLRGLLLMLFWSAPPGNRSSSSFSYSVSGSKLAQADVIYPERLMQAIPYKLSIIQQNCRFWGH